jgi:hypothetical protein
MKLYEILETYDTHLLDQISADKVDETITLRLPATVSIKERKPWKASALLVLKFTASFV